MPDQIIDAAGAQERQAFAIRSRRLWGWIVIRDQLDYPGEVTARLCIADPTPYLLVADTLADLQAQLPVGLVRSDRQPLDPPEVLEIWFPA
jgi:hypothetical protein